MTLQDTKASGPAAAGAGPQQGQQGGNGPQEQQQRWALALHGGAGMINSDNPEWVAATRAALERALDVGTKLLAAGAAALDAAVATVAALEDDPCLNAGRGSVLTASGRHELEASVMAGDGRCGAACLLGRVKNPVKLAKVVMDATPHVLLSGARAEALAVEHGLELAPDNSWFTTPQRRAQWEAWHARGTVASHDDIVQQAAAATPDGGPQETVGAVARDVHGRLAAATSTGGRCGKYDGRIGDTPVIGAGTWADARVALSGTGIGEAFQRRAACADVAARVKYAGQSLAGAVAAVVHDDMAPGDGGFIGVDAAGGIVMNFNTPGMGRACADSGGRREVAIFRDG